MLNGLYPGSRVDSMILIFHVKPSTSQRAGTRKIQKNIKNWEVLAGYGYDMDHLI